VAGAFRLWRARNGIAADYNAAKDIAVAGLVCGLALWFFGFLTVGGEWFQMWQSKTWNGEEAAFRFVTCIGLVLIFLSQRDDEI
jgi:predicted small integral membrane protein